IRFRTIGQTLRNYNQSVPFPFIVLALPGALIALRRHGFFGRVLALLLPLSALCIIVFGLLLRDLAVFQQLEGPRLIPMLRPATLFLAALALHELPRRVARRWWPRDATLAAGLASLGLVAVVLLTPLSPLHADQRGLP